MGNVTDRVRAEALRIRAALLLNFCRSVVQPENDQLQTAMQEYEQSLRAEQEPQAA